MSYIIEKAYGKINLFLNIENKRPDGYHNIKTIFQTISLADEVILEEKDRGIDLICNNSSLPCDEGNLIYKTALLIKEKTALNKGVKIILKKEIPVAAGLGGGSADAASTIKGLNRLWNLRLSQKEMIEIAKKIGSDVPFLISGGTAFAEGRGEKIISFFPTPDLWAVIIKPDISISTPWAYSQWKPDLKIKNNIEDVIEGIKCKNFLKKGLLFNSFEKIVEKHYPVIKDIKKIFYELDCPDCLLSGSGSSVFGLTEEYKKAQDIKEAFENKKYIKSFISKTLGSNFNETC